MKMKIKGKVIIPLIAILIAMFTIGITPGAAADTTVSDSLTYVPPTFQPTSSLEEEIEGFVSNAFGDDLQGAGEGFRPISEFMASLLNSIRNALNAIIAMFEGFGGMMGNIGSGGTILG